MFGEINNMNKEELEIWQNNALIVASITGGPLVPLIMWIHYFIEIPNVYHGFTAIHLYVTFLFLLCFFTRIEYRTKIKNKYIKIYRHVMVALQFIIYGVHLVYHVFFL